MMSVVFVLLGYTDGDRWLPGIGDPTVMGWITVVFYFIAAGLSWRRFRGLRPEALPERRERWFWLGLALFLVVLGVNKQLDLQTWFTLAARRRIIDAGLYEYRRAFQMLFIGLLLAGAVAGFAGLLWSVRGRFERVRVALVGALFIGIFVIVRAASFHHVDQWLGWRLAGFKLNWILELGGILCVIFGALRRG
jgi:hypothetical protein